MLALLRVPSELCSGRLLGSFVSFTRQFEHRIVASVIRGSLTLYVNNFDAFLRLFRTWVLCRLYGSAQCGWFDRLMLHTRTDVPGTLRCRRDYTTNTGWSALCLASALRRKQEKAPPPSTEHVPRARGGNLLPLPCLRDRVTRDASSNYRWIGVRAAKTLKTLNRIMKPSCI